MSNAEPSLADHALAIANLKAAYCRAADTFPEDREAALAALLAVFADDPVADYGYGPLTGAAAISDFLGTAIAGGSQWMIHMLQSPRIVIDGAQATGEWAVTVQSRKVGGDEVATVVGRYSDEFRLTADGWRITRIGFWRPA